MIKLGVELEEEIYAIKELLWHGNFSYLSFLSKGLGTQKCQIKGIARCKLFIEPTDINMALMNWIL